QLLELVAPGARHAGAAARLDAIAEEPGARAGGTQPAAVPRARRTLNHGHRPRSIRMTIRTHTADGGARIEIARPEKKNALTVAMYQQLADAIGAANDDATVRALLIHGGPDIFTAGNDLEDFRNAAPRNDMDAP